MKTSSEILKSHEDKVVLSGTVKTEVLKMLNEALREGMEEGAMIADAAATIYCPDLGDRIRSRKEEVR